MVGIYIKLLRYFLIYSKAINSCSKNTGNKMLNSREDLCEDIMLRA